MYAFSNHIHPFNYEGDPEPIVHEALTQLLQDEAQHSPPYPLYPQFMDDDIETETVLGLFVGLVLLQKCRGVWAFYYLTQNRKEVMA